MKSKFTFVLVFVALLLFVVSSLTVCKSEARELKEQLNAFQEILESEDWDHLRLKVYYIDPSILTRAPLSVEALKKEGIRKLVEIDGANLKEHKYLLDQLNPANIYSIESDAYLNARICLTFEYNNQIILEIVLGFPYNGTYVNNIKVAPNQLFYRIMKTFLSENTVQELSPYFSETPSN